MTDDERKAIARRLLENAGQGNIAIVEGLISDDFVLEQMVHDPQTSTSAAGVRYDRATYLSFLQMVGAMTQSGMNLKFELIVAERENVAVFGTSDAVAPSGWHYRNAYCWHIAFRHDKVCLMREFYDTALTNRLMQG